MRYNVSTTRCSSVFPVFTLTSSLRFGPSDFLVTGTLKAWSAISDLPRIAAPTLVLHGQHDVAQDCAVAPFFWRIPRARWCTLEGASHFAHLEQPERFLELVGSFLTRSEETKV